MKVEYLKTNRVNCLKQVNYSLKAPTENTFPHDDIVDWPS